MYYTVTILQYVMVAKKFSGVITLIFREDVVTRNNYRFVNFSRKKKQRNVDRCQPQAITVGWSARYENIYGETSIVKNICKYLYQPVGSHLDNCSSHHPCCQIAVYFTIKYRKMNYCGERWLQKQYRCKILQIL